MTTDFKSEYRAKLIEKDRILSLLRPGDRILCHGGLDSFLTYLDENVEKLEDADVYTMFLLAREYRFLDNRYRGHLRHHSSFVSGPVRAAMARGQIQEFHITQFSESDDYVRYVNPTVFAVQVTPMDKDGWFTMGYNSMGHQTAAELADRVIVQVNPRLPLILGECNRLHISRVTAIYEDEGLLPTLPAVKYGEDDLAAAKLIAGRIPDGATIQIGVGRVPDAIGDFLLDHRHLGVHTEVFTASLMELMKAGVIDNSQKALVPGKSVFAFTGGTRTTQEIYDFVDGNRDLEMRAVSWVNDSRVIAQNNRFVSVNSALAVDLTGQICAESVGLRQFSGTGGQLDFVRGARWAAGGRSYIVMNSAARKRDGTLLSKIDLTLPAGSAVTTPRSLVDCVVTEYGVAELRFASIAQRARALIAIAHPAFRDELTRKAKEAGYFL